MYRSIAQRKKDEAERRARGVDAMSRRLESFARDKGGRYLLYGSAARGQIRHDSDVDLLLDFPADWEAEAWRLAEDLSADLGVDADIKPLGWCEGDFAEKVLQEARIIG